MSSDPILRFIGCDFPQLSPSQHQYLHRLSWGGQIAVPASVALYALWKNDKKGFIRLALALIVNQVCLEVLKKVTVERRPDGNLGSFPSGHTAAAFLGVAFLASRYDCSIILAMGVACAVGVSRVVLSAHWVHDVIAGALLGYVIGRFSGTFPT